MPCSPIQAGKTIALANKEILVMAGAIVMDAARRKGGAVLPVDSEHNAIHQCLHGRSSADVSRLILTASGGPFRDLPLQDIATVSPEEALRHPTWTMGPKITIDSATLMNKGLEVIEARWLFDVAPDRIQVLIHPQSIVHSMVELVDGSIIGNWASPTCVSLSSTRSRTPHGGRRRCLLSILPVRQGSILRRPTRRDSRASGWRFARSQETRAFRLC